MQLVVVFGIGWSRSRGQACEGGINDDIFKLGLASGASAITSASAFYTYHAIKSGPLLRVQLAQLGSAVANDRIEVVAQEAYHRLVSGLGRAESEKLVVLGAPNARRAMYPSTDGAVIGALFDGS